jgi:hypothetical protein
METEEGSLMKSFVRKRVKPWVCLYEPYPELVNGSMIPTSLDWPRLHVVAIVTWFSLHILIYMQPLSNYKIVSYQHEFLYISRVPEVLLRENSTNAYILSWILLVRKLVIGLIIRHASLHIVDKIIIPNQGTFFFTLSSTLISFKYVDQYFIHSAFTNINISWARS